MAQSKALHSNKNLVLGISSEKNEAFKNNSYKIMATITILQKALNL